MTTLPTTRSAADTRATGLVLLLVTSTLIFSRAFACATPFAALCAVAGTQLRRRDAVVAALLAWGANQAIGFGWLGYPHDPSTLGWGVAIGIAVGAATLVASASRVARWGLAGATAIAFAGAFATYETVLVVASLGLPSSHAAFSAWVVGRILAINLAALGLWLVGRLAVADQIARRRLRAADGAGRPA